MILLIIAAWLGVSLAERNSESTGVGKADVNNLAFHGFIAFVVGGRISYALQHMGIFGKSPADILSINPDLFDPLGGIAAGFIAVLVYSQRNNIGAWNAMDALTPLFAAIGIGLGLSRLASGGAFGIPTDLPWGIHLWNATRHPTQIYDALASSLILALIWRFKPSLRPGLLFLTFSALTAFSQLVLQAFRADAILIFGGIRQSQVMAWVALATSFVLIEARSSSKNQKAG